MKPPPFAYHRPSTVAEAVEILAEVGDGGKVLAGGQSLVPLLNMRLAAPSALVDINRLTELAYVDTDEATVRVGALARHAQTERDPHAFAALALLREATRSVAHPTIRNRGTTVGSLVHADPAAEMPAVLAVLDGTLEVRSAGGAREVPAAELFVGPMESSLRPGELAVAARFPRPPARSGTAFVELARRHGDYAMAGLAAVVATDPDGALTRARVAYISLGPGPVVVDLADAITGSGGGLDPARVRALVDDRIDPEDDIHATADYRRHLAHVLTDRALREAQGRAVA